LSVRHIFLFLFSVLAVAATAEEPRGVLRDPVAWLQRASDQMNLRMPGSAPFHMKVSFQALPGIELNKKPQILSGQGSYEEIWVSPKQWRREVSLGSYHAVEVAYNGQRKFQASSDFEPGRVLMLLEALLNPVPRNYLSPELNDIPLAWKIEDHAADKTPYVRIGRSIMGMQHSFVSSYTFLPSGLLVLSNEAGLVTGRQDDIVFAGKVVARRITVQAGGQEVLAADVVVEAADKIDPETFDIPGAPASPGRTMRPLHFYETSKLSLSVDFSILGSSPTASAIRQVIDRHGVPRETELLTGESKDGSAALMDGLRRASGHPAKIDNDPCETVIYGYY